MADDSHSLLSTRGLSRLLYQMGRTFDGLSSTRMATEEFLSTGNPRVLASKNDLALLTDLKDASEFVLHRDWGQTTVDLALVRSINARLKRTAAIEPGILRISENVVVTTPKGDYIPHVPRSVELERVIARDAADPDTLHAATRLFADLAKAQPFGDGNKRTALLAANAMLLKRRIDGMVSVPTEEPDRGTFDRLLADWYLDADPSIVDWLARWNTMHPGT